MQLCNYGGLETISRYMLALWLEHEVTMTSHEDNGTSMEECVITVLMMGLLDTHVAAKSLVKDAELVCFVFRCDPSGLTQQRKILCTIS